MKAGEYILDAVLSLMMVGSLCVRIGAQDAPQAKQLAVHASNLARSGHPGQAEALMRKAVALAPTDATILAGLGSILGMEGKLPQATTYFEKSLKADPTSVSVRRDLAATQWQLRRWDAAKRNLQQILRTQPHDPPTILLLGMVEVDTKDYKNGAKLLASVPGLVRQRPQSIAALVRAYYKVGETAKAREVLTSLLHPHVSSHAVFLGAEIAEEADDYEMASRLFESLRSNYPNQAALQFNLARVKFESGHYVQSRMLLERLIRAGHATSDVYNLLGGCYEKQHHPAQAINALEKAIALNPSREANYKDLTDIFMTQKNPNKAIAAAKKWAEHFPSSYLAFAYLGAAQMRLLFYKDAASSYEHAVELRPSSSEALLGLGRADSAAGLTTQAEAAFEKGIHRFPHVGAFYEEYGSLLLKQSVTGSTEVRERAVSMLETSIRLDGSDWHAQYLLGNFLLSQGKTQKAIPYLKAATHLAPKESEIHFALWRAYRKMGRNKQAAQEMTTFQNLRKAGSTSRTREHGN